MIKKIIRNNLWRFNRFPFVNNFVGNTQIEFNFSRVKNTTFHDIGRENSVKMCGINATNCKFYFYGNNNSVIIEKGCILNNAEFWIEDDNNSVIIGADTLMTGKIQLACIEGTRIIIGSNCLFSSEIAIRTGDSHSILNANGERINPSKDVKVADHVWIGHRVVINKGVSLLENSIVGSCSVVTKPIEESNVIIAGNPGMVVKRNVNWDISRL